MVFSGPFAIYLEPASRQHISAHKRNPLVVVASPKRIGRRCQILLPECLTKRKQIPPANAIPRHDKSSPETEKQTGHPLGFHNQQCSDEQSVIVKRYCVEVLRFRKSSPNALEAQPSNADVQWLSNTDQEMRKSRCGVREQDCVGYSRPPP